jgi:hypothetical protein
MITIPGTSQHTAAVAGTAWLVEMEFTTGTQRVTTAPVTIVEGGRTWTALGTLGAVSPVIESEEVNGDQITLSLSIVDRAMVAAALGNVESYRGRRVTLYLQLLDEKFQPVGTRVQRWSGLMEKVSIKRKTGGSGTNASTGSIDMLCSRRSLSRMRNEKGLRLTPEQWALKYPGETGLRYIRTLIEKPTLWLSKDFQAKLR